MNVGAVIAKFTADLADFKSGLNQVRSQISGLSGVFGSVGNAVTSVFSKIGDTITQAIGQATSIAKTLGVAGVAGIGALGIKALNTAGDLQQISLALETLLGSEEKAYQAMKGIKEDAAKTPFDLREVARANQMLISTGISAEDSRKTILDLGNAIVASGGGNAEFSRMVGNLQQISNVGKATTMDIRQFGFAGINIYKLLADSTGKSVDELKEMDISYQMLADALAKAREEGGLYAGALEKQGNSWNLLKSNLSDVFNIILSDVVTGTGVFQFFNEKLSEFVAFLTNNKDSIVAFFTDIFAVVAGFFEMVKTDDMQAFQDAMAKFGVSQEVIDAFGVFSGYLRDFGNWVLENKDTILTFLQGLAIGFGALLIIGTIAGLISALMNPIVLVAGAIALLYTAWQTNFLGIQDITKAVLDAIMGFWNEHKAQFEAIWNNILKIAQFFGQVITKWWQDHSQGIINILQGAWTIISAIFKYALDTIIAMVQFWTSVFTGDWKGAWDAVQNIQKAGADFVVNILQGMLQIITGILQNLFTQFSETFQKVWNTAKEYAEKIRHAISDAFNVGKKNSPSILDRLNEIKSSAEDILSSINIDSFSHNIAEGLAGITRNGLNVNGVNDGNFNGTNQVVQYVTVTVSDPIDVETLSQRLAYGARNS